MTPNIPPGWIAKALEAGRRYWDASFFLGMCQADVDPKRLEDGEVTEEEFSSARTALVKAEDDLRDAEAALTIFSNEAGYPMSATELQVRLTASPGAIDRQLLRAIVDAAWNEATESTAVPSTVWADRIIDGVLAASPGGKEKP